MLIETLKWIGKTVTLGIVFEVTDDPDDAGSLHFTHTKPIDVWVFLGTAKFRKDEYSAKTLAKRSDAECIRSLTKSTPLELRTYAINTTQDGFLHVVATPTPEWAGKYKERIYEPIPVKTGHVYNFGVSLPPA